ncbi:hypothetical protein GCM10027051_28320 [Niabella terrae]
MQFLTIYAIISSLAILFLFYSFTVKDRQLTTDEITAKKINIIGEDGSLRLVLSNEDRQHSGIVAGRKLPARQRPAGLIFFNNQGDECGGLIYEVSGDGQDTTNEMILTMDNYHDDQVVQILNKEIYRDGSPRITRGLQFNEYPEGTSLMSRYDRYKEIEKIRDSSLRSEKITAIHSREEARKRLFIGRNADETTGLFLYDQQGRPRMKIYLDSTGAPRMEILDVQGRSRQLPLD